MSDSNNKKVYKPSVLGEEVANMRASLLLGESIDPPTVSELIGGVYGGRTGGGSTNKSKKKSKSKKKKRMSK
jgi:hypothetical protein